MDQKWLAFLGAMIFGGFLASGGFLMIHLQKLEKRRKRGEGAPTPPAHR